MTIDAIRALLAREPRTLSMLEADLRVSLQRDRQGEEAWLVQRKAILPGINFLHVAMMGPDLPAVSDPLIGELRLFTDSIDLRAEATKLLGAPGRGGDPTQVIHEWKWGLGKLAIYDKNPAQLFWFRNEGDYETEWLPEQVEFIQQALARLASAPLDLGLVQQAFGTLVMSGRWSQYFRRGPTWKLAVEPLRQAPLKQVTLNFSPPLPVERVLEALALGPTLASTAGVHQDVAFVIDEKTLHRPERHGSRIDISLTSVRDGTPSPVRVPAQRAFETTGLKVRWVAFYPSAK